MLKVPDGIRRRAMEALALQPGDVVIDAGCGTGWCLPMLLEAVGPSGRVIGFDPSEDMLAVAREREAVRRAGNVLLRDGGTARSIKFRARGERGQVIAERERLDFLEEGREFGTRLRQALVVPGRRRVGRQRERVGLVDARIELRLIDAVVERQDFCDHR